MQSRAARKAVGRCKICNWSEARTFNRRATQGNWNSAQAQAWSEPRGLTFDRKTFYAHKPHMLHPADAIVSYGDRAVAQAWPTVTQTDFYQSIRDIGFKNAMDAPEDITLTQAMKAADALERRKEQGQDFLAVMAKLIMGAPIRDVVTIEGDYEQIGD